MPSWDSKNHREFLGVSTASFGSKIDENDGCQCHGCFRCCDGISNYRVQDWFCTPCYGVLFVHQTWDGIGVSLVVGLVHAGFLKTNHADLKTTAESGCEKTVVHETPPNNP